LIKKNNTKKSSKLLYSNIIDTIYTESPKRFAELLDFIFCQDVVELLDEVKMNFLKSLVTIKEKWAAAHVPLMFNAGFQSTLKAEAVNYLIKRGMQQRYSLVNLFAEILKIEARAIRQCQDLIIAKEKIESPVGAARFDESFLPYSASAAHNTGDMNLSHVAARDSEESKTDVRNDLKSPILQEIKTDFTFWAFD